MKMQKVTELNCAELCSNCNLQCPVKKVANCSLFVDDLFPFWLWASPEAVNFFIWPHGADQLECADLRQILRIKGLLAKYLWQS